MPTNQSPTKGNPESWEHHETQIRLERADEFAKLTPAEQQKVLAEEKIRFEETQKKIKADFGFKPFDPTKAKAGRPSPEQEDLDRKKALAEFEHSLNESPDSKSKKEALKEKEATFDEKRFYKLFEAAITNIAETKTFEFQSVALDDFGQASSHLAKMTKLKDYSQKEELEPGAILSRLQEKKSNPNKITVRVEIEMGESQKDNLSLTNLSFEIPLVALMEGRFLEKLSNFTNLALFAALLHGRQKTKPINKERVPKTKSGAPAESTKEKPLNKFGLIKVAENGGLQGGAGAFEQGDVSTVSFSCNNGFIWGTFDQHRVPTDPKQLQEAIDKNTLEP